ncbi:hypothetical protein [Candidatus Magnetominusculus dajiuhuensis]|uniref:hypothetical protein n=1 Tax=Candidatus Magnetominusculus dajiuhuensis TaxID=3137712 RepID=UPI003B427D9A
MAEDTENTTTQAPEDTTGAGELPAADAPGTVKEETPGDDDGDDPVDDPAVGD